MKISRILPVSTLEVLIGILATGLIVTGLLFYALLEPERIDRAQASQLALNLDDATTLYAENCTVCHGLAGEGIGATPPLNNPNLSASDPQALYKTISRGLYGTSMPAWSLEDGGPLSDYQIDQLVQLIQYGDWQVTQDRVVDLGLAGPVDLLDLVDGADLVHEVGHLGSAGSSAGIVRGAVVLILNERPNQSFITVSSPRCTPASVCTRRIASSAPPT